MNCEQLEPTPFGWFIEATGEPVFTRDEEIVKTAEFFNWPVIPLYKELKLAKAQVPESLEPGLEWAIARCSALQSQGFDMINVSTFEIDLRNCLLSQRKQGGD